MTKKQTPTADRPLKRFSSHAPVVRLKKESEMAIHRVRYRCSIWPGYSSSRTSATAQTYFGVGRSARVQTYDSSCPSLFFSLLRRGDIKTNKKVVIRITSFRAPATLWNKKKNRNEASVQLIFLLPYQILFYMLQQPLPYLHSVRLLDVETDARMME